MNEPAHIQLMHKTWDVKQSPADPTQLLLTVILTAATALPPAEVEAIKERVLKEGIRVYVTSGIETEMLMAMRMALLRAETERDQNRARADHHLAEAEKAGRRIAALEAELKEKRATLSFLEEGLSNTAWRA